MGCVIFRSPCTKQSSRAISHASMVLQSDVSETVCSSDIRINAAMRTYMVEPHHLECFQNTKSPYVKTSFPVVSCDYEM